MSKEGGGEEGAGLPSPTIKDMVAPQRVDLSAWAKSRWQHAVMASLFEVEATVLLKLKKEILG